MAVCVLARNDLSGKPDGGVEMLFGKPNEFAGESALVKLRASSRARAVHHLLATCYLIPATEIQCAMRYDRRINGNGLGSAKNGYSRQADSCRWNSLLTPLAAHLAVGVARLE